MIMDEENELDLDEENESEEGESSSEQETFTQEDFDKAMIKVRQAARNGAKKSLFEELGVKNVTEAKSLVDAARNKNDRKASKDDEESSEAIAENLALKAQIQEMQADAQLRETNGKIKDSLVEAGLTAKAASKALKLVEIDDPDPSDDEIEEAILELKESMPALFAEVSNDEDEDNSDTAGTNKGSTQPPRPKPKRKGGSAADRASEILRQRHPQPTS